jgi:hypothetical protein
MDSYSLSLAGPFAIPRWFPPFGRRRLVGAGGPGRTSPEGVRPSKPSLLTVIFVALWRDLPGRRLLFCGLACTRALKRCRAALRRVMSALARSRRTPKMMRVLTI